MSLSSSYIKVEPSTGEGALNIPLAPLMVNGGRTVGFELGLSNPHSGVSDLDLFPSGLYAIRSVNEVNPKPNTGEFRIPLYDGRTIAFSEDDGKQIRGSDFMVDISDHTVTVHHSNGVSEIFDKRGVFLRYALLRREISYPCGTHLNFIWENLELDNTGVNECSRIVEINDGKSKLMIAKWWLRESKTDRSTFEKKSVLDSMFPRPTPTLEEAVFFPDTDEEFCCRGKSLESDTFEVSGSGIIGKIRYSIGSAHNKVQSLAVETIHPMETGEPEVSTLCESLTYEAERIIRHAITPGGGLDEVTVDYAYTDNKTTVSVSQGELTSKTEYTFAHGTECSRSVIVNGVESRIEQSAVRDDERQVMVITTKEITGDVINEVTQEFDGSGNLIAATRGDEITEYTYYNNYQEYTVKEVRTVTHDTGVFGILGKTFDYMNPIGLGFVLFGNGGLTWGTKLETTVHMDASANDYAKEAFNLPVDVKYPGENRGFATFLESMLVCRKVGDKKQPVSLTYFGYQKLDRLGVVPSVKLTVLQPDFTVVDVSAQQLAVARKAATPFIKSLTSQKNGVPEKEKAHYQDILDELNKSLEAQSKANARGFKLNRWTAQSMQVERLNYHTGQGSAGFGKISEHSTVMLDSDGREIAGSKSLTEFTYHADETGPHRLTIRSRTKAAGEVDITTLQTLSTLTGRVYERREADGTNVVTTYANGFPDKTIVTQGDTALGSTTYAITAVEGNKLQYQSHSTEKGCHSRQILDELGREVESSVSIDGKNWQVMSAVTYDGNGREKTLSEYDYDAKGTKISCRVTTSAYAADASKCTTTTVLKNADDKILDTHTQVTQHDANGETLTVGAYKVHRHYDHAKRVQSETFDGKYRVEHHHASNGQLESVRDTALNVGGGTDVWSEHDHTDYSYDSMGRLQTITPKVGAATTYTYDPFNRLLSTETDGVTISNAYSSNTIAAVATLGTVSDSNGEVKLGSQTLDGLARVVSRTVGGSTSTLSYEGVSLWGKSSEVESVTTCMTGYKRERRDNGLTLSESITRDDSTHTSTSTYSWCATTLAFEDIQGEKTLYEYDACGRLIRSSNASCETTYQYRDDGLLAKETIKAVKQDITLAVTYDYDPMGQESSRTFDCQGFDKHAVKRSLLTDGRLEKSTLVVGSEERRSDDYQYTPGGRLESWSCSGEGVKVNDLRDIRYVSRSLSYDSLGNVVSFEGTLYAGSNSPENLSEYSGSSTFDATKPGAMLSWCNRETEVDDRGRQTRRMTRKITYHDNSQVKTYTATSDVDSPDYVFEYDDQGRVRGGTAGPSRDTYHYRGQRIYACVQEDAAETSAFSKRLLVLKNDSSGCWMQTVSTTVGGQENNGATFELRDAAGTVFASFDLESKSVKYFAYTPYGDCQLDPSGVNWRGFKGEVVNRFGLYYLGNGYRLYDPELQRFQTPDHWSPFGEGGVAAYAYCSGDPVNYHDPSGHQEVAHYGRVIAQPWMYTKAFRWTAAVAGVLTAPFTGGCSLAVSAGMTGLALVSFGFEAASILLDESDPELAKTLEYLGAGFGFAGMGLDVARGFAGTGRAATSLSRVDDVAQSSLARLSGPGPKGPQSWTFHSKKGDKLFKLHSHPKNKTLLIDAHGESVRGTFYADGTVPPATFTTKATKQIGFFADQGFTTSFPHGRDYVELLTGKVAPKHFYRDTYPNYVLTELTDKFTAAEFGITIKQAKQLKNQIVGDVRSGLANMDYLTPLEPVALDAVFDLLEREGYQYQKVIALHCRGELLHTKTPFRWRKAVSGVLDERDRAFRLNSLTKRTPFQQMWI